MPTLQAGRPSRPGKSAGGFPTTAYGSSTNTGGIQLVPTAQAQTQQQLPIATSGDELEDVTQNPQIPTTASAGPAFQFVDNTPGWKKFLFGVGGVATPNVGMMNAQLALAHQAQQEQQAFEMQRLAAAGDIQRRNELDRINALPAANALQAKLIAQQAAAQRIDDARKYTQGMIPDDAAKQYFSQIGVVPEWDMATNSYRNPEAVKQAFDSLRMNVDLDKVQNRALSSVKEIPVGSLSTLTPNLVSTATRREYANQAEADARSSGAEANELKNQLERTKTSILLNQINHPGAQQDEVSKNLFTNLNAGLLAQQVHNQKSGEIIVNPGQTIFTTADGTQPAGSWYDPARQMGLRPDGTIGMIDKSSPATFIPYQSPEAKAAADAKAAAKVKEIQDQYNSRQNTKLTTADIENLYPALKSTSPLKPDDAPLYEPDDSALSRHNMAVSDLTRLARLGLKVNPNAIPNTLGLGSVIPGIGPIDDFANVPNYHIPMTEVDSRRNKIELNKLLEKGRKLRGLPSTATQVK